MYKHNTRKKLNRIYEYCGDASLYDSRKDFRKMYNLLWNWDKNLSRAHYALAFYGLFPFEIELINLGFKVERMSHMNALNPGRTYIKDGKRVSFDLQGWNSIYFAVWYDNRTEFKGIPSIKEIRDIVL